MLVRLRVQIPNVLATSKLGLSHKLLLPTRPSKCPSFSQTVDKVTLWSESCQITIAVVDH